MEQLLTRGVAISELAYLRILQLIHVETSTLVDDLKTHELPSMVPSRSSLSSAEFRKSLTNQSSSAISTSTTTVAAMLETAMEELFVPYIEGQKYLEREAKCLTKLYTSLVENFSHYHVGCQVYICRSADTWC